MILKQWPISCLSKHTQFSCVLSCDSVVQQTGAKLARVNQLLNSKFSLERSGISESIMFGSTSNLQLRIYTLRCTSVVSIDRKQGL